MDQLTGRVVVVTGAASGIGLAMARAFAAEGARLVLADIERGALNDAASTFDGECLAVPTDVSDADQVDALAAATLERFGAVHVVCANAGVGSRGLPVTDLPRSDFQWLIGVNLNGVINTVTAFLPHLIAADEAHLVTTSSIAGWVNLPGMAPYNATKAAVLALTETMALELETEAPHVGVSVLCPGWVRTNLGASDRNRPEALAATFTTEQATKVQARRERIREIFTRDAIDPEEVASLVVDAVRARRFYITTHPAMNDAVMTRMQRFAAGNNPEIPKV